MGTARHVGDAALCSSGLRRQGAHEEILSGPGVLHTLHIHVL